MNFAEFSESFEYNTVLNPKLWNNDKLKPQVQGALLRIAEDFKKYVEIPFKVVDVVITGSNVNYNYTSQSDLDLHLIADFDTVKCDREAAELFDTKRHLYDREHDVEIYGIPVGLYVENKETPGVSAGTYSVLRSQWIKQPNKDIPDYDEEEVNRLTDRWTEVIQTAAKTGDLQVCRKTVQLLRKFRKMGLDTPQGEFSTANLVYKNLRNADVVSGITTLIDRLHDQQLSLR
jgi:hypothetical protein